MSAGLDPQSAAATLRAFAHPTRLMILQELLKCTRCVTDMKKLLTVRQEKSCPEGDVMRPHPLAKNDVTVTAAAGFHFQPMRSTPGPPCA